ncbi:serine/threonine-protein kinase [Pseudarthrobacter sp. NamE5]|uniref:protein kinase domain-containing protein n=1 Tax=Pseudarthrobacter sp. NamE5 TaxID=2576839 RepID=UPI00110A45AE|nr:serine/threonine-protein kinase [Pseudarthrobacter sp. NamE5]TLM83828.1 serine/threonine protein kinase [Pseudarthrobacter sp. NamE5]
MEDLQAPEVPGFAVGRLLGVGGSASVWLAKDQRTGRDCALKCFGPGSGRARGAEAMSEDAVRREIRILSVLDHQHLVRARDAVPTAGVHGTGTALVMDYAPGGSLASLVAGRGKLSVGETVTVLTPIAQALSYLHHKGFTHSDVSPGNVLFTGQGKPLLSDVGIARMLGDPGGARNSGTPGFVDPAPIDAVRGLQPERDVYSAAALGWFCLTGHAPPRTADRPPLSLLVPEVPRELAAALEWGLNENRRERPNAAALAAAVYRSAAPLPLDLAASVHPTVIPELLTRRHVPAPSRLGRGREKFRSAGRRLATAAWPRVPFSVPRMPFPQRDRNLRPSRGRHAGKVGRNPRSLKRLLCTVLPAVAAAAAAGAWWLAGAAGPPAESAQAPGSAAVNPEAAATAAAARESSGANSEPDFAAAARKQARSADPAQAVAGLGALRDLAFSRGSFELLDEVNVEGSPAARADARTAGELRSSGHVLAGFSSTLKDLRAEEGATAAHAVVSLLSGSSAYEERDARGSVVRRGTAGSPVELRLVLVAVDGRWRISEILPGS